MDTLPRQWMSQQQQAGRRLCLILDGNHAACQPLLAARDLPAYCGLYVQTPLAEIATAGPLILLLEQVNEPALLDLLQAPETNWGWLGSLPNVDLTGVIRHWRDRLLVGQPGSQALYRVHDNRTLARALNHLDVAHWPAFLGPLIGVCYWYEGAWHSAENPAPGDYLVPEPAPWLSIPNPNAGAIQRANILRYLLAEYSEKLAALVEFHDPGVWLTHVLEQARAWRWNQ
ncbi:hypothetical protein AO262_19815, partial [Pseudomonas fluorescens ABAC62]